MVLWLSLLVPFYNPVDCKLGLTVDTAEIEFDRSGLRRLRGIRMLFILGTMGPIPSETSSYVKWLLERLTLEDTNANNVQVSNTKKLIENDGLVISRPLSSPEPRLSVVINPTPEQIKLIARVVELDMSGHSEQAQEEAKPLYVALKELAAHPPDQASAVPNAFDAVLAASVQTVTDRITELSLLEQTLIDIVPPEPEVADEPAEPVVETIESGLLDTPAGPDPVEYVTPPPDEHKTEVDEITATPIPVPPPVDEPATLEEPEVILPVATEETKAVMKQRLAKYLFPVLTKVRSDLTNRNKSQISYDGVKNLITQCRVPETYVAIAFHCLRELGILGASVNKGKTNLYRVDMRKSFDEADVLAVVLAYRKPLPQLLPVVAQQALTPAPHITSAGVTPAPRPQMPAPVIPAAASRPSEADELGDDDPGDLLSAMMDKAAHYYTRTNQLTDELSQSRLNESVATGLVEEADRENKELRRQLELMGAEKAQLEADVLALQLSRTAERNEHVAQLAAMQTENDRLMNEQRWAGQNPKVRAEAKALLQKMNQTN